MRGLECVIAVIEHPRELGDIKTENERKPVLNMQTKSRERKNKLLNDLARVPFYDSITVLGMSSEC